LAFERAIELIDDPSFEIDEALLQDAALAGARCGHHLEAVAFAVEALARVRKQG
jgi:hypothetical protein